MKSLLRNFYIAVVLLAAAMVSAPANATPPVMSADLTEIGIAPELVQGCAPGYNFDYRRGGCYPASGYGGRPRGYDGGGYLPRGCPPGYNFDGSGCVPANYYGGRGYGCPPGTNPAGGGCVPSRGFGCPPGYNNLGGQCYPNR
jgi:hypothetical protein